MQPVDERGTPRSVILVSSYPGQASSDELARLAASGLRPRKDYVELARALDADVVDAHYMRERGAPLAKALVKLLPGWVGLTVGQVAEAFLRRRSYGYICAWADRIGLTLALLYKLARSRRDLVLISAWPTGKKKSFFFRRLGVHTHLRAITNSSSLQLEILAERLNVPRQRLHHVGQRVDTQFWRPEDAMDTEFISSVGWEARDYATLAKAVRGLDVDVRVAVGAGDVVFSLAADVAEEPEPEGREQPQLYPLDELMKGTAGYRFYRRWRAELGLDGVPENMRFVQLDPLRLRTLYSRSRFVVVPLYDVEFDAGVTTVAEAMAMRKAVIVTQTRGQRDFVRDGENGLYVPPGDPSALRAAIVHLARHPEEAERMGRAGHRFIHEGHTLDHYVRRLAAVIREA